MAQKTTPRTMEQLATVQELYSQEIQRVISNYKKDSNDRKTTASYYQERLRRLNAAWSLFDSIDEEIRNLPSPPLEHPYFTSNSYKTMAKIYEDYTQYFSNKIEQFEESTSKQSIDQVEKASSEDSTRNHTNCKDQSSSNNPMSQSVEIIKIIRRQRAVIQSLRRLLSSLENLDETQQPRAYYELKLNLIQNYWSQIEEHNNTIWELADDPTSTEYNPSEYIQLEEVVQTKLIQLSAKLEKQNQPSASSIQTANAALQLPKITLPKFDGDYAKWRQFFDLFSQMVHNQALSNCQKMWYLKMNLVGEAEKLIRHFSLSDENYNAAWKLLQERYENPRLLVAALINKLLNQPSHATDAPSATSIKSMHDITQECLLGLENLGVPTTNWDPLLLHILYKKLDRGTHTLYEQSLTNPKGLQSVKDFLAFLETRFQSLEALGNKGKKSEGNGRIQEVSKSSSLASTVASNPKCVTCSGNHPLFRCHNFLKMTPSARLTVLQRHNLCYNCLRKGHSASKCSIRGCTKCNYKHNTLVHNESSTRTGDSTSKVTSATSDKEVESSCISAANMKSNQHPLALTTLTKPNQGSYILLSTARVKLISNDGHEIECRAILDSGSQLNLITERAVRKLGITPCHVPMHIQGIGQASQKTQKRVNVQLNSMINGFTTRVEAFVLSKIISPHPSQPLKTSNWAIPKNIQLADPAFYNPDQIDLLLGAEFFMQLLSIGQIKLGQDLPTLQNTVLGWVVTGRLNQTTESTAMCGVCTDEMDIDFLLEKFWQIEDSDETQGTSTTLAEKQCEEIFNQTIKTNLDGRFTVGLPFLEDPKNLGESKEIALRRFYALERKLNKNNDLRHQYTTFMDEYLDLGHMEEVDVNSIPTPNYFLPHHCVLKPGSSTTKLRVVFDASAKTSTNISLNDILHKGPTIQDDLFSILLRFRLPRFVFTADIEKMYRQVVLQEEDRRYHLIWWRRDPNQELKCYRLRTITYGTTSAPYLATRCLQHLAQQENIKYPIGSQVLRQDFYVDDVMTGANSLTTARDMQTQLIAILKEAGFKLRKWCANHAQLLQDIPPADQEIRLDFTDEKTSCIKTLGLTWLPKTDQFQTKLTVNEEQRLTKRTVASEIARIFDPLGIMAPVVIKAKIFLQSLWELKVHWDASLTEELHTKWMNFRKNLSALNDVRIPRHVFAGSIPRVIQIHAFSDASEKAFGAAIYIRSLNSQGRVIVRLLCAKTRVAPKKKLSVPRLELCAAKLGAELLQRVKRSLKLEQAASYLWCDSEIVLDWINSTSTSYQTFVGNRIAAIQTVSLPQQWRHVKSEENPADILSRGLSPEKLSSCNLWFYGPLFLHGSEEIWPPPYTKASECDLERKRATLSITTTKDEDKNVHFIERIDHKNSFQRLKRVTGYVLRFVSRSKSKQKQSTTSATASTLTASELDEALFTIIKLMQQREFQEDIRCLLRYTEVSKSSPLATLAPFLDPKGIIRVGGRLEDSGLTYDSKHPMLLPHSHELTKLIMSDYHKENYHTGPQGLLSAIRQRFWPIKGKSIARSIVQHCIQCARNKPKLMTQIMGNLPAARVQPARPFINSGVDFCGPIWIHYKVRGKRPHKAYVAIFCCFATKAVHLEVVSDLTTEAFIGALKRFIGRRGHCRNLYCDNATNFVGARNQLAKLTEVIHSHQGQEKITSMCSQKGIDFHFIPPRSPHFGGLWEAAVKSAKHLLVGTISSASLTYEELETALIDVEAILNSRPLTPLSSDPNDLSALTPGHLLIGGPLTAPIDSQAKPLKTKLLKRWELVHDLKQQFWKRWSLEYLNELQYRSKWKHQSPNAMPGMLVILKEENTPVQQWPLGRIVEIHKGKDGYVRVADVRTATGILRRPIHKLAPLPLEKDIDNESEVPQDGHTQTIYKAQGLNLHKRPNDESDIAKPSPEMPTKRTKTSLGTSLLTLLLTVCMVPLVKSDLIEITQFKPQLGIHFEDLGATHLITSDWNLIVYYDLDPYWMELGILENGTKALKTLCDQFTPKSACRQIISQFEHLQNEVNTGNKLLSPQLNPNPGRQKRGAFNIVGNVANALFGVLDQQYAEEMSKTIQSINDNEEHMMTLLKNQTSVIDSTINIVKKDQAAVKQKFDSLDDYIIQITNRLNRFDDQNSTIRAQQQFMSLALQMSLVTTNLQHIQALIIDVITDTNHGRINPLLVTPSQLQQAVSVIRNNLQSTLRLPTHQDNILELYKLMNVKGRVTQDHVIFQIKIPLVNWETFDLLRIFPIPVWINNSFVAVQPHAPFLVIAQHRDRFYPITELELSTCTTIEGKTHLCKQIHPIYHRGANICACEMDFLNNDPRLEHCKFTHMLDHPIWLQLTNANQWMFAVSGNTSINVVCDNQMFSKTLNGTGLLKIQPQCTIKEKLVTIHGHRLFTTGIKSSYTVMGVSMDHLPAARSPLTTKHVTAYHPQLNELLELHERITNLKLDRLPERIQKNTIHHFSISYLALFAVLLVGIYLFWKSGCESCKRYKTKPRPTPSPRQHINQVHQI